MFKDYNEKTFVTTMASDLQMLCDVISRENKIIRSVSSLSKIISTLKKSNKFEYDLSPLEFIFVDYPRHLSHKKVSNLRLLFTMKLSGNHSNIPNYLDSFNSLEFNIVVYGTNINNIQSELAYSLHFDRHIEGGHEPDEVHPIYHFQYGGRKVKEKDIDYGQALFMDTPRIMHHPMDIFLGLDFLLSNFFPTTWRNLKKDGRYNNIIRKYQKYFVYPYFKIIANHFEESHKQAWHSQNIFPQLIEVKY